jgi:hypothetical protein
VPAPRREPELKLEREREPELVPEPELELVPELVQLRQPAPRR